MISLLNFGSSPFRILFFLVVGISLLVLLTNLVAYLMVKVIRARTVRIMRSR